MVRCNLLGIVRKNTYRYKCVLIFTLLVILYFMLNIVSFDNLLKLSNGFQISVKHNFLFAKDALIKTTKLISTNNEEIVPGHIRQFINTRKELELTKNVTMMPFKVVCNENKRISIYILSSPNGYERRRLLRKTWVSDIRRYNISVFFAIALTVNQTNQQILEEENQKYGDLIQFGFIDSYYNLTLKSISILRWTQTFCRTEFVLKGDDDILVNVPLFLNNLNKFKPGIHGILYKRAPPVQDATNKWFMPKLVYGEKYFPDYTGGPAYLIAGYKVEELLKGLDFYPGYIMTMEDVFLTGVIARSVGVHRFNSTLIYKYCHRKCALANLAILCSCESSEQMIKRWTEINSPLKLCVLTKKWHKKNKSQLLKKPFFLSNSSVL